LHFSGLPIDLRIVVLEPSVTEDHALLPEVGDGEEHPFRVSFIMEDHVYHLRDLSGFIRGTVHVEHWYGARDVSGANTLHTDKIFIYKIARGSGVQKHFDGVYFASIRGSDFYRENDRRSAGVEGIGRELSGESLFPFGPPRQGCSDRSGGGRCVYRFTDICIDFFYVQYSEPIY